MDVFDDASQMDDTIPMDAQTPTAFSAEEHEALMAVPAATVNAAAVWNYTR